MQRRVRIRLAAPPPTQVIVNNDFYVDFIAYFPAVCKVIPQTETIQ
jgi:hypothetical protein